MSHRKLRIAWSVAWGLLAVLLCVLWVRSYRYHEHLAGTIMQDAAPDADGWRVGTTVFVISESGVLTYFSETRATRGKEFPPWEYVRTAGLEKRPTWNFEQSRKAMRLCVPHWFAILMISALASVQWLQFVRFRFSLRTLLIATTLVAVVLGLIVWLSK